MAGGDSNLGDSSNDCDEEPDKRKNLGRWKRCYRKMKKKTKDMEMFIDMVKLVAGKGRNEKESRREGKSPDPQPFDGNPDQLKRFLRQLGNKFALE